MSESQTTVNQIDDSDNEKFHLMKSALMQVVSHNDWDRTGIYQLLNRLMLLFVPIPTAFIVYKENFNQNVFHTFKDPVNVKNFSKKIDEFEQREREKLERNAVEIFGTKFFLVALRVVRKYGSSDRELDYDFFQQGHYTLEILKRLFDARNLHNYNLYLDFDFNAYWAEKLIGVSKQNTQFSSELTNPKLLKIDNRLAPMRAIEKGILESSYRNCKNSPLVSVRERLPNISFFIRTYEKSGEQTLGRYGNCYNYNVRLVLPKTQEEDFKEALKDLHEMNANSWDKNTWHFRGDEFEHFKDVELKSIVFQLTQSEEGIRTAIRVLKMPYGKHARCFVDPIFSVGVMNTRAGVFNGTFGLDKILKEKWYDNTVHLDKVRIALLYYLFNMMSPKHIQQNSVSCVVKPLRVGGSPWICMATFTNGQTSKSSGISYENAEHFSFQRNYQGYFEIFCRVGKTIRHRAKRSHLRTIKYIIYDACGKFLNSPEGEVGLAELDYKGTIELANEQFNSLAALVPFCRVKIKQVDSDGDDTFYFMDELNVCLKIELESNPYYPLIIDSEFMTVHEVRLAIQHGCQKFINTLALNRYENKQRH